MNVLERKNRRRVTYWEILGRRMKEKYWTEIMDPSYNQSTSSVSFSDSSPPWLGDVEIFSPTNLRLPITFLSSLPLHSGGAWLWG
jgi:hypothetical protein